MPRNRRTARRVAIRPLDTLAESHDASPTMDGDLGRTRHRRWTAVGLWLVAGCRTALAPAPPDQPASGPGGADYKHEAVDTIEVGEGAESYWLFTPTGPQPEIAPLVIFLHGWTAENPRIYGAWIEHLVRKGHIVVYPRYQTELTTLPIAMQENARRAVKAAWESLNTVGPTRPYPDGIAWVGHSFGGLMAPILASAYAEDGLPAPVALMCVEPGDLDRLSLPARFTTSSATLALVVVGDTDDVVGDRTALAIFAALDDIPTSNKDFLTVRSERRSFPLLRADHFSPLAVNVTFPPSAPPQDEDEVEAGLRTLRVRLPALQQVEPDATRLGPNALDYYGYWKLLDGLLDAAFRGVNREYALGNTVQQRFMGVLSDGTPVEPLQAARVP